MRHEIILQNKDADARFFHSHSDGNEVTPHWHHSLELIYLHSGSLRVEFPGRKVSLHADEFIVINSCAVHAVISDKNDALVLQIPYELLCAQIEHFELLDFEVPMHPEEQEAQQRLEQLKKALREMLTLADERPEGYLLQFKSLLYGLLYQLLRDYSAKKVRSEVEQNIRHLDRLAKATGFLEQHHAERVRVRDVAEMMGYNEDYISRLFKKYMGIGIIDYLYELRIGYVYRDLTRTALPIGEIYERHGCHNRKLAQRLFKERYGAAPGEIRKKMKNE